MVMYGNDLKTKEIKFKPRVKLNHNIYIPSAFIDCVYCFCEKILQVPH